MAGNVNNIIVGSATLAIDGVDVGHTQGGVTTRSAKDYLDVETDQLAGVARKEITLERMFLSTTMLEATLANMRQAMNEPAANQGGSSLSFGSGSPSSNEHVLTIVGKSPTSGAFTVRTYTFHRAIASEEVEHPIGMRDGVSVVPVTFELLKDPDNTDKFGFYVDS